MKLEIRNLEFSYGSRRVLRGVTMNVGEAEIVGLIGPNGAGKTTLLRCICRVLRPSRGSIIINGRDINELSGKELAKKVGYIPQYTPITFPITVFEAVLLGRVPYLNWAPHRKDIQKVQEALKLMEIENFALRYLDELSGGEKQKAFIARIIAQEPELLLLDEPTANLDLKHQLEVMDLIKSLVKRKGISVIVAIHDLNLASKYSDRIVVLNSGKIIHAGTPKSIITRENVKSIYRVEPEIHLVNDRPRVLL